MRNIICLVLSLTVLGAALGCSGKDDGDKQKDGDKPKKPRTQASAAPAGDHEPSGRPKEYIEASEIFERLTTAPSEGPSTRPAPLPGKNVSNSPSGAKGATGPTGEAAAKPAEPKGPKPGEDKPATQPAKPAKPAKAKRPKFQPVRRLREHGYVDWSRGVIVSTGIGKANRAGAQGKLMAYRAAEIRAKRNALVIAAGIKVQARRRVRVQGMVRFAKAVKKTFDEATRTAQVTIEVPVYGLKGVVRTNKEKVKVKGKRWRWIVRDPVEEESDLILIDVRGKAFEPLLAPKLLNEDGQIVFDPAADAADLGERHAFVYAAYRGRGAITRFGGFRRVILLCPSKVTNDSLILSAEDLKTLMRHADARELLRAGRAVIVLSARPAAEPT